MGVDVGLDIRVLMLGGLDIRVVLGGLVLRVVVVLM